MTIENCIAHVCAYLKATYVRTLSTSLLPILLHSFEYLGSRTMVITEDHPGFAAMWNWLGLVEMRHIIRLTISWNNMIHSYEFP